MTLPETYIAAWNETDAAARKALIAKTFAADATYVDPLAAVAGHEQVDAMIAGAQARFPGFRFTLIGEPDSHGEHLRLAHDMGVPLLLGTDAGSMGVEHGYALFDEIDRLSESADERGEALLGSLYDYAETIAPKRM